MWWHRWLGRQTRHRLANQVVEQLDTPPTRLPAWLRTSDPARALSALRIAPWAMGRIVAESDALDDQTAADVAHAIDRTARLSTTSIADLWPESWAGYAVARQARTNGGSLDDRLASEFLRQAAVADPTSEECRLARALVGHLRSTANASLCAVYGIASLPEDQRPSAALGSHR